MGTDWKDGYEYDNYTRKNAQDLRGTHQTYAAAHDPR